MQLYEDDRELWGIYRYRPAWAVSQTSDQVPFVMLVEVVVALWQGPSRWPTAAACWNWLGRPAVTMYLPYGAESSRHAMLPLVPLSLPSAAGPLQMLHAWRGCRRRRPQPP